MMTGFYLISPYLVAKAQIAYFLSPKRANSMNNDKTPTGKCNGAYSHDMDLTKIKKLCKQLGCTHNDMMTTILSNTLYEHFKKTGENPKSVNIGIPFSLRNAPKKVEDIRLNNDMVGLNTEIELFENFDQGLK